MAKRKRLTPLPQATSGPEETKDAPRSAPGAAPAMARPGLATPAPVAQVSGDAAQSAALEEITAYIARARADGLMLSLLPLARIDAGYLHRDRIMAEDDAATMADDPDMAALIDSIRARGQQVPIDVVRLTGDPRDRYGLIAGMRRLRALQHLSAETGEARFAQVIARVVPREGQAEAYVAMVEENEIRADISFWERARIVQRSVDAGAYPDRRAALRGLFANVSRAKRSKIGSFVDLVVALDGVLRFPTALSEKRGLALSRAVGDDAVLARIRDALAAAAPTSPEAEAAALDAAVKPAARTRPSAAPANEKPPRAPVEIAMQDGCLTLTGPGVDDDLHRDLAAWLKRR
ncbi:ParB/RepB/Spo0J family partition protein [Jannaschia sp. 2305UL9-9]|uniref:ParB/RepB/Spo0J family partition protein n=1 Tax=Jannaschia sp. 2305UL9-9 TaxID=3121638 RepID=UPI00352902F0